MSKSLLFESLSLFSVGPNEAIKESQLSETSSYSITERAGIFLGEISKLFF